MEYATTLQITVYPNPVSDKGTITYSMPASAPVLLSVYNPDGKLISILVHSYQQGGVHQVQLNSTLLKTPGTYILQLTVNGKVMTRAFIKGR